MEGETTGDCKPIGLITSLIDTGEIIITMHKISKNKGIIMRVKWCCRGRNIRKKSSKKLRR